MKIEIEANGNKIDFEFYDKEKCLNVTKQATLILKKMIRLQKLQRITK